MNSALLIGLVHSTLALMGDVPAFLDQEGAVTPTASVQDAVPANPGDVLHVHAVAKFSEAVAQANANHQLLLLKPIYGGCDAVGLLDYRAGSW